MPEVASTDTPIPPRFWWLRRLGAAAAVFVLSLAGVRVWWGHVAESRLQAKIAEYRAAGQPVLIEDFAVEPVPDEENGAYFLRQAASLAQPKEEMTDIAYDARLRAEHANELQQYVVANAAALKLIREARSKTRTDWNQKLTSPVITMLLPNLSPQRMLAKLARTAALQQHAVGNDAEAVEMMHDILDLARHVDRTSPCLISFLVAIAIDALGTSTVEYMSHDLLIATKNPATRDAAQPATRQQVEDLIRDLLEEQGLDDAWRHNLCGERMGQVDTMLGVIRRSPTSLLGNASLVAEPFLTPAWKLDTVILMERTTATIEAGLAPSWPAAQAALPNPHPSPRCSADQIAHLFGSILPGADDGAVQLRFRLLNERRMAALALAIRLYEVEHGHRPAALSELVPDYLPAVPRDPFDADNGSIRYRPDAPSPLLYSVGLNGIDENGAFSGSADWRPKDIPFFLNGDRPRPVPRRDATSQSSPRPTAPPTSTQAVVDDQQPEDADRKQRE